MQETYMWPTKFKIFIWSFRKKFAYSRPCGVSDFLNLMFVGKTRNKRTNKQDNSFQILIIDKEIGYKSDRNEAGVRCSSLGGIFWKDDFKIRPEQ